MRARILAAVVAVSLLSASAKPVWAENQMGYRLLSQQEAAGLQNNHGALGLDVERSQQITDGGMTFDIMRIKRVRPGSSGERAGFRQGDSIIAVNGRVFPSMATFAAYVGSTSPGTSINVDYIPSNGGPAQAQRVSVVVGVAGQQVQGGQPTTTGLSTGEKVAIGVGAVALLGCYKMGCFSHRPTRAVSEPAPSQRPTQLQGNGQSR